MSARPNERRVQHASREWGAQVGGHDWEDPTVANARLEIDEILVLDPSDYAAALLTVSVDQQEA